MSDAAPAPDAASAAPKAAPAPGAAAEDPAAADAPAAEGDPAQAVVAPATDAEAAPAAADASPAEAAVDAPAADAGDAAAAPAADAPPDADAAAAEAPPADAAVASADAPAPEADAADSKPADGVAAPAGADGAAAVDVPAGDVTASAEASASKDQDASGESLPADAASPSAQAAGEEAATDPPSVERVEVPDLRVDVNADRPGSAKMQAQAEKLREAVADAFAEFGTSFDGLDDTEVKSALSDWKAQLDSHVAELTNIMQKQLSPVGEQTLNPLDSGTNESGTNEIDDVRSMRQQLECHRTGRDIEEVTSAWADPEETAKEVEELQRVRRQIRYLFGGMIGNLPETTNMRVDDLLNDPAAAEARIPSPPKGPKPSSPGRAMPSRPPRPHQEDTLSSPSRPPPVSRFAEASQLRSAVPTMAGRPHSGGTEDLESVTNSSVATFNSREDSSRRHDRKSGRNRSQRRDREQREAARDVKKEDGSLPSKQWNWAEEVVKASLDPGNQWEFPAGDLGKRGASPMSPHSRDNPQWEQPRQRGNDIALKARERAEQVIRSEREQQRML